jgi:hypothetical protein
MNQLVPSGKSLQAYLIVVDASTNIKLTDERAAFIFCCASNFVLREEHS